LIAPGSPLTTDVNIKACSLYIQATAGDANRNVFGLVGMLKDSAGRTGVIAELKTPAGQVPDRMFFQDQEATNSMQLSRYAVDGDSGAAGLIVTYWTN